MTKQEWLKHLIDGANGYIDGLKGYTIIFDEFDLKFKFKDKSNNWIVDKDINFVTADSIDGYEIAGGVLDYRVLEHTIKTWSETRYPDNMTPHGFIATLDRLYKGRYNKDHALEIMSRYKI